MAISVLNGRTVRNGTGFPLNSYEEPFGTIEDSAFLPAPTLEQNSKDGIIKILFFSYRHLDEILSTFFSTRYPTQVLNSRIISVTMEGKVANLAAPVRISLKHLREEGVGRPTCVYWDREATAWSDVGCAVVDSNKTRTVCQCSHLSSFALLMEEEAVTTVVQLPDFHVEIIAASVAVGLILICLVVALRVCFFLYFLKPKN